MSESLRKRFNDPLWSSICRVYPPATNCGRPLALCKLLQDIFPILRPLRRIVTMGFHILVRLRRVHSTMSHFICGNNGSRSVDPMITVHIDGFLTTGDRCVDRIDCRLHLRDRRHCQITHSHRFVFNSRAMVVCPALFCIHKGGY